MFSFMIRSSLICGAIATVYWLIRKQSVRKGFGFTFHWWALGDLGAGALICAIAMVGIFLVEWLLGGIQVEGFQIDLEALSYWFRNDAFTAVLEEVISRSLQLSGFHVGLGVLVALLLSQLLGGTFPSRLDRVLGWCKWGAIVISAIVFGYAHINNPGASAFTAFGNALGGIIYGIAFLGGRNIWLPIGLHFGWNYVQGPILGFPVSGNDHGGLIAQQTIGSDLLTGGAFGPEGGLVGMFFRFVVIAMVLYYLHRRCDRQGDIKHLNFPISIYDNPPRRKSGDTPEAQPG
ncbi:CPBP family intramembrane metalloprotease [Nodosilinea sp. LEGE 07298]|uniref:CPBP family intramembrane glutamic endopeptidase n=1 Tax=Nodosilinea sp. LEGE 07298 TaxID=2777970 RepID=UPI0018821047|nr:CPBP family intramembrane glutamic endopeptidase [Nodosilinea sp. LEGE 07298]MBE9111543.1 CPBP family intramembrane metalloprotease [Nodosilinea sp. LEGE 07298]